MNEEEFETVRKGLAGCAGAGCMLYLIGFLLFILAIVAFAFLSTPNPYGP